MSMSNDWLLARMCTGTCSILRYAEEPHINPLLVVRKNISILIPVTETEHPEVVKGKNSTKLMRWETKSALCINTVNLCLRDIMLWQGAWRNNVAQSEWSEKIDLLWLKAKHKIEAILLSEKPAVVNEPLYMTQRELIKLPRVRRVRAETGELHCNKLLFGKRSYLPGTWIFF